MCGPPQGTECKLCIQINCLQMRLVHNDMVLHSKQELISRLDSLTLRTVNVLGLLVFSNNIYNGISNIGHTSNNGVPLKSGLRVIKGTLRRRIAYIFFDPS